MCCWVQPETRLKEARKTEENSALVVTTGEGWSTVPNRLQCFDQQRQRCSLSRKREDKKFSWVRQEPQQRGAMRTEEKSALVVAAGEMEICNQETAVPQATKTEMLSEQKARR